MRNRKKRIMISGRAVSALVLAGIAATGALGLYAWLPGLAEAARRAAYLSAAIAMPDAGLPLLQERFRAEIYGGADKPDTPHDSVPFINPAPEEPKIDVPPQAPSPSSTPPASSEEPAAPPVRLPPRIPSEYAGPVISEDFAGREGGTLLKYEAGYIKNDTKHSNGDVAEILAEPMKLSFESGDEPQVLILHTHATESFETWDAEEYDTRNTWRSTDNSRNMVAVGDEMRRVLEDYGISVLHDSTQHDYPSYNGSYERSAETIREYLKKYPSIKVVLDLHRDAMARGDAIVKPVAMVNGQKAAQIMIISGCDDGTMNMPKWRENLRFAASFQSYMEQNSPGLTRPVYLCYRKYNMDLTAGSLLLEFGSNANTLEEAMYSAELAGHALAALIVDRTDLPIP